MSPLDDPPVPAPNQPVGARIRRARDRIIRRWEERARSEIAALGRRERHTVVDSLPDYLEQLADALATGNAGNEMTDRTAAEHGAQRAKLGDCTVGELIQEYDLLRLTLFEVLEREAPLDPADRDRLLGALAATLQKSAIHFIRQQGLAGQQAFQATEQAEAQTASILEGSRDGVFGLDREWHFTFVNDEAIRILYGDADAKTRADLIGRKMLDDPPTTAPSKLFWAQIEALEKRLPVRFDQLFPKLGRWIEVSAYPTRSGVNVFFRDLTELKRAESSLKESEATFRSMVEVVQDYAIFMLDAQGNVASWNAGAEKIKQYKADEVLGQYFGMLYTPEDMAAGRPAKNLANAMIKGRHEDEWWRMRKDGSRFWASVIITALYDENGVLRGFSKVLRDLTERKRVEEEERFLADATAALASSLDYVDTLRKVTRLAVPTHADWCVVDVRSEDGEDWVGRLIAHREHEKEIILQEMLRQDPRFLELPEGPAKVFRTSDPVLVPELDDAAFDVFAKDHDHVAALRTIGLKSFLSVPLLARGRTFGTLTLGSSAPARSYGVKELTFAREFAQRAAIAIDNARLYQQGRRAIALRDEILAIVSHDLKNPLSAIVNAVELIKRVQLPGREGEQLGKRAEVIGRSVDRMNRLISDLLDISRIEAGRLRIEAQEFNADELVEELIEMFRPLAEQKRIAFTAELARKNCLLRGDKERLLQVFSNLIGNALKFTPERGAITIRLEACGDDILFRVRDTGPGISEQDLANVFDRFWQARERSREGSGLGLSIAKGIVEAHGGAIWVDSEIGRGTTFSVRLPKGEVQGDVLAS